MKHEWTQPPYSIWLYCVICGKRAYDLVRDMHEPCVADREIIQDAPEDFTRPFRLPDYPNSGSRVV